jgi:hypothetical protein
MTNSTFNFYARAQAALNGVRLVERDQIVKALEDPGITFKEIQTFMR